MKQEDFDSFDDAALKDAIRRAWKDDAAPPELIARIRSASICPAPTLGRSIRRMSLAAAAVILIGLAIVGYRTRGVPPAVRSTVATLPAPLAAELVDRHDQCCSHADHQMPGIPRTYSGITTTLSARLGWPVLAKPLGDDWIFKGASICPVGSQDSAHLVFKRGNEDASVFSLPLSVIAAGRNNALFDQIQNQHPIASFISNGGLYCIVCSSPDGSMTLDTAKALRTRLQTELQTSKANERTTVAGR